ETLIINQMKASAYQALGNSCAMAKSAEAAVAGGGGGRYKKIAANGDFGFGDLEKIKQFAGSSPQMQTLRAQQLVKQRKYGEAQQAIRGAIAQGGPQEQYMLILYDAQAKGGDSKGAADTIQTLLRGHPKPEYWKFVLTGMLNQKISDKA